MLIQCEDGITLSPGTTPNTHLMHPTHSLVAPVVAAAYLMKQTNCEARQALHTVEQAYPKVLIDGVWARRCAVPPKLVDVLCEYEKGGIGYKSVLEHTPPKSKVCNRLRRTMSACFVQGQLFDAYRRKHLQIDGTRTAESSTDGFFSGSPTSQKLARASTLVE